MMKQGMINGRGMIIWLVPAIVLALVWILIHAGRQPLPEPPATEVIPEPVYQSAVEERMADPVYVEALNGLTAERRVKVRAAHGIQARMDARASVIVDELKAEAGGGEVKAVAPAVDADREMSVVSPPAADAGLAPLLAERLQARLRRDTEWTELETERAAVELELRLIQRRVEELIRTRMHEQVADHRASGTRMPVRPPAEIKTAPHPPAFSPTDPAIVIDAPEGTADRLPVPPDRRPVGGAETVDDAGGVRQERLPTGD